MRNLIEKIFIGICRLPIIDRFIRVPDQLWNSGEFRLDYQHLTSSNSHVQLPSIEYLKDSQILKEHLKHILSISWTTRAQFEYEYVNMLTLLNILTRDDQQQQQQSTSGNLHHVMQMQM